MAQRIYASPLPPQTLYNRSVFTHLFSSKDSTDVGGYHGSTPAFIHAETGTTITRVQLKSFALSLANGLKTRLNAKCGDTILIYSPNSLVWPVVLFGAVAAGLRCTLANSAYNARELAFQYQDSRAGFIFASEDNVLVVRQTLHDLGLSETEADKRIVVMTNSLHWAGGPSISVKPELAGLLTTTDLLQSGSLEGEVKFEGDLANETVYLCYSSGTTGKPKGVETTHRNITSVLEIVKVAFPALKHDEDAMLGILPFYHIYGAVKLLHFPFTCGIPVVIMTRFDPVQFCANVERYKITCSLIVPPVLVVLARHPAVDKYDLSTLRILFSGAAPLGAALARQVRLSNEVRDLEGLKDVRLEAGFLRRGESKAKSKFSKWSDERISSEGYGLTETSPTTHLVPVEAGERKVGSIGLLLPNLEARLVIDGDGNGDVDTAEGQAGELWIRGPTVMKGYLNNPTATKDAITPDGWFKTGDIAIRDSEGYYYIVDRRKELIKYKGFQVPPAELESVLLTHPDIADAAVIGVESAKEATELPRAYVVHANPHKLETEEQRIAFADSIKKWIQGKVARHKFLRGGVVIIDVIPKSAAGKILRRDLRERAKQELAGRDPADDSVKSKL